MLEEPYKEEVSAYEGNIGSDTILGYHWLRKCKINVQPWRDALQLHDDPRWVLAKPHVTPKAVRGDHVGQVTSAPKSQEGAEASTSSRLPQTSMIARVQVMEEEDVKMEVEKMRPCLVEEVDLDEDKVEVEEIDLKERELLAGNIREACE